MDVSPNVFGTSLLISPTVIWDLLMAIPATSADIPRLQYPDSSGCDIWINDASILICSDSKILEIFARRHGTRSTSPFESAWLTLPPGENVLRRYLSDNVSSSGIASSKLITCINSRSLRLGASLVFNWLIRVLGAEAPVPKKMLIPGLIVEIIFSGEVSRFSHSGKVLFFILFSNLN